METKVCTKCGKRKPLEEFRSRPEVRDGRTARCKECLNAGTDAWRAANRERNRLTGRAWRDTHRQHINSHARDKGFVSDHNRLRQLRKQGVTIVEKVRRKVVFERAGGCCQECGAGLTFRGGSRWDVDHIVPISHGGEHSYANTQALCWSCHKDKTKSEQSKQEV